MKTASRSSRRGVLAVAMFLAAPGLTACAPTERRIVDPETHWAAAEVEARVEERKGKRKPTWKPFVAGALAAVTAGAVTMLWFGFLNANRPMSVAGIVGSVVVPTFGSIPFLVRQDTPWTTTEWQAWQPAGDQHAALDVIGREEKPLATHALVTDANGALHIPFSTTLCNDAKVRELQLVDLVVRVPKTDGASVTIATERLGCGGGRISLLHNEAGGEHGDL